MAEKNENISSPLSTEDHQVYANNAGAFRKDTKPSEVVEYYNNWSYSQDLNPKKYKGPFHAGETVARYIPQERRDSARVLDVAAGTGYVGVQLKCRGFKYIDALDPAKSMLDESRKYNCYSNYFCDKLGGERSCIAEGSYDAVVTSGGMGEGHIPATGIQVMAKLTKPGGFVCIVMREEYLTIVDTYRGKLEPLMARMEAEGIWRRRERTVVSDYFLNKTGVILVFEIARRNTNDNEG